MSGNLLYYRPRGTYYRIINNTISIKQEDGSWKIGVLYQAFDGHLYARSRDLFKDEKWVFEEDEPDSEFFSPKKCIFRRQ